MPMLTTQSKSAAPTALSTPTKVFMCVAATVMPTIAIEMLTI